MNTRLTCRCGIYTHAAVVPENFRLHADAQRFRNLPNLKNL